MKKFFAIFIISLCANQAFAQSLSSDLASLEVSLDVLKNSIKPEFTQEDVNYAKKVLINSDQSININNLYKVARYDKVVSAEYPKYLKIGVMLNLIDKDFCINNQSLLSIATEGNNYEVVKFLVDQGADIDNKCNYSNFYYHPLRIAAQVQGAAPLITLLIEKTKKPNEPLWDNNPPIFNTINSQQPIEETWRLENLKAFINGGANILSLGKDNNTLLHVAAKNGYSKVVEFLLSQDAIGKAVDQVNARNSSGITPLMYAVTSQPVFDFFKQNKQVVYDATDRNERTALHHAIMPYEPRSEIIAFLLEKGLKADAQDKPLNALADESGNTPLHLLAHKSYSDWLANQDECHSAAQLLVKNIIENKKNIDIKNENGNTPLHHAAQKGNYDLAQYLINQGASKSMKNNQNRTPYDLFIDQRLPIERAVLDPRYQRKLVVDLEAMQKLLKL